MDILDIAKRECKGEATVEEVTWLSLPYMRIDWLNALITALNELDSQMTYHRDRITMMTDDVKLDIVSTREYTFEKDKFDAWQRRALRYKAGLQGRVNDVKIMLVSGDDSPRPEVLTAAIILHKQQSESYGLTPEPHDIELWSSITK